LVVGGTTLRVVGDAPAEANDRALLMYVYSRGTLISGPISQTVLPFVAARMAWKKKFVPTMRKSYLTDLKNLVEWNVLKSR
jgi:hypothetical protein